MKPSIRSFALAGALCLLPVTTASQAPTVIKLATLVPEGSVWDKALRESGAEWSRDTQGRVSLRVYPGGVAGAEPDVIRKMRNGQLHAGALTTVGLAEIDPAFNAFTIPMFFDSYPELYAVLARVEPVLRERLEAKGFVLLCWGHGGWLHFFSKQRAGTVAEMRKAKLFVPAGNDRMVQVWKAVGFTPVALAPTDILTALQTGMIDSYPITPLIALSLQWFKQTPNMTGLGMAPLVGGLIMSKQAWGKISEPDRVKMLASCRSLGRRLEAVVPSQDSIAVVEMQKRGLTVNPVSPAAASEWRAMADQLAAGMRGGMIPPEFLEIVQRERDTYQRTVAGGTR